MGYPSGCDMPWKVPKKLWKDETVFVLGSGPSIKNLVGKMDLFKNRKVIAVHDAFLLDSSGFYTDVLFIGDARFYWENETRRKIVDKFAGLKVSSNIQVVNKWDTLEGRSDIKIVDIVWKKPGLFTGLRDTIYYNGGAGNAAISLVANLGAKKIILYGFDCKFTHGRLHHFPSIHEKSSQIKVWSEGRIWDGILKDAKRHNIEIVNTTPDSDLEYVKKVNLKDYLK